MEALQIALKRREGNIKGEKERYKHLNAEFQKPSSAINAKKQRKTTEWERLAISLRKLEIRREHLRPGGHNKGQNGKDLAETEEIKKRWQEYTELYKKGLNDPDNGDGVISHLEPDILECKVKWPWEASL